MRIVVVDDEPPARARLRGLLKEIGGHEVVAEAAHGAEALAAVDRTQAELLLLDIRMPGMDGLEVASHLATLPEPPAVIFTTAYDAHALAAIEANAVDYLLKPIRRERLIAALGRAMTLTRAQVASLQSADAGAVSARTHISATLHGGLRLVPIAEVRYFRAEHKYVTARYPDGELVIEDPLTALEEEFRGRFIRVHRNALVAASHVRALERDTHGHYRVDFDGIDEPVEVSRRLVSQVRRELRLG
jgi:two-component system response regulator AlgR